MPLTESRERVRPFPLYVLGVDPAHVHVLLVGEAGVCQRLFHGYVGVVQVHVLAYYGDGQRVFGPLDGAYHCLPVGQVLPLGGKVKAVHYEFAQGLLFQD